MQTLQMKWMKYWVRIPAINVNIEILELVGRSDGRRVDPRILATVIPACHGHNVMDWAR